jgi:DNA (cytosine-5)-methyltransferase 1
VLRSGFKFQTKSYAKLKFDYLSLLKTKKISKGDVRAFIGLKTWLHERERLKTSEDDYSAHISAFGKAIGVIRKSIEDDTFHKEFSQDLKTWFRHGGPVSRKGCNNPLLPPPIPKMSDWKGNGLTLISLFSGALGLDLGFLASGFDMRLANDIDKSSFETVSKNVPSIPFIHNDFAKVSSDVVLNKAGLDIGKVDVLTGGPPCQPFSTAGRRQGLLDPRASPLRVFVRAIKEIQPKAFVMEEVTGLRSARLKHVPISERGGRALTPEEKKGSAFNVVLQMLHSTNYRILWDVLNAADFGAPQSRNRLIFIGLKGGVPTLPVPTHSDKPQAGLDGRTLKPWNTFWECSADIQGKEDDFTPLSQKTDEYMKFIPPGGYWRHLPKDVIKEAMGGAYSSGGGKMGYFRRLSWDEPSPTVVTSPVQKGTMFCHPEASRPLSIREYKRIQGFPDDWEIVGNASKKYRQIGNAVPVHLSYAIAKKVSELLGIPTKG